MPRYNVSSKSSVRRHHPVPVTSLAKIKAGETEKLHKWREKLSPVVLEPKYDGLTVVAYPQKDGSYKFVTRGSGTDGEVLPNFISKYEGNVFAEGTYAIRGEVAMRYYPLLGSVTGANIRLRPDEPAVPISSLHGRLLSYGHAVSTEAPLVPVLFEIDNNGGLLPGAFVDLFILADDRRPVLSVPSGALVEEMGNYFVYVQLTPEFFEKREVSIGRTDGVRTEVTSGLTGTERVVSRGAVPSHR